jgi:hypothetical protein
MHLFEEDGKTFMGRLLHLNRVFYPKQDGICELASNHFPLKNPINPSMGRHAHDSGDRQARRLCTTKKHQPSSFTHHPRLLSSLLRDSGLRRRQLPRYRRPV